MGKENVQHASDGTDAIGQERARELTLELDQTLTVPSVTRPRSPRELCMEVMEAKATLTFFFLGKNIAALSFIHVVEYSAKKMMG